MAGLGVLVAPSTHTESTLTLIDQVSVHWAGSAVCEDGFHEWVVTDRKFQSGRRSALATHCFLRFRQSSSILTTPW